MNDDDTKNTVNDDEMNENQEIDGVVDTQEESMESTVVDETAATPAGDNSAVPTNWIEVKNGKFVCSECENESEPETNTVDGTVKADTAQIQSELEEKPTKIVYGSCPVCGMEYLMKASNGKLFMEPSDMLK